MFGAPGCVLSRTVFACLGILWLIPCKRQREMYFRAVENKYLDNLMPVVGAPFGPLFELECGPWR